MVEVRILGPVEVLDVHGRPQRIGGQRPGTILLTLALAAGTVVSPERLVHELWGEQAPATALGSLQSHLSRLRRALEPELAAHAPSSVLLREAGGYRLASGTRIDASVFEAEVAAAREGLGAVRGRSQPEAAALSRSDTVASLHATEPFLARLRGALALWRGEVGEGLEIGGRNRAEVRRLDELRLAALETRVEVELGLGRHADVAIELEALVARYPVREHLQGLLMLALYRCGRQADALAAFRRARTQLVETLGVDPGRQLAGLHDRILAQDPALDPPMPAVVPHAVADDDEGFPDAADVPPAAGGRQPERSAASPTPGLGNLPLPLVELVGREDQRRAIATALGQHRLVTLTGAGGCGKTQLALAVAHEAAGRYPDGTWWVDLQSLGDPSLVVSAVAEVLGVDEADGATPQLDALLARLDGRRALVVIDNCEHLIDSCAHLVRALLLGCPQLHLLTTSRQPLDVDAERVWRVPSLTVPPAGADLAAVRSSEAGQLLLRLGAAARDGFTPAAHEAPALALICRELDGIPLALELAAARLRVLSVEELAERLDDRFRVLWSSRRGAPPRHRTLEAAIGWSFELLEEPARQLLARLAIFRSGPSLEAVEAVCTDEQLPREDVLGLLEELVDRSLVTTVPRVVGPTAHDLLASIRSFARQRLDAEEAAQLRGRHARWYAGLADRAAKELTGPEQVRWLNRLHAEHDDLRAALEWSLQQGEVELAARMGAGAWWFWLQFGHAREGAVWLEQILAAGAGAAGGAPASGAAGGAPASGATALEPELEQQVAYAAGRLSAAIGAPERARTHLERGVALAVDLGAPCREALCRARLLQLGPLAPTPAAAPVDLAVATATAGCGDPWVQASVADVAGHLAIAAGDLDAAAAAFRRSETAYLEVEDRWSACLSRLGRAWLARRRGRWDEALQLHAQNLDTTRTLTRSAYDFIGLARDLRGVAEVASHRGAHAAAARLCGASENLRSLGEVALGSDERAEVEQVLERIRAALGDVGADREQAAGRALTGGEALELAALVAAELLGDDAGGGRAAMVSAGQGVSRTVRREGRT